METHRSRISASLRYFSPILSSDQPPTRPPRLRSDVYLRRHPAGSSPPRHPLLIWNRHPAPAHLGTAAIRFPRDPATRPASREQVLTAAVSADVVSRLVQNRACVH